MEVEMKSDKESRREETGEREERFHSGERAVVGLPRPTAVSSLSFDLRPA